MGKDKQYWSVAETISLLKLWSSLRQHLDRATRTKDSYEEIQRALAAQGHERELEQIVNKIKKLKMEFREMNRSEVDRNYGLKRNLYFEFLEKAFGSREAGVESEEEGVSERSSQDGPSKTQSSWVSTATLAKHTVKTEPTEHDSVVPLCLEPAVCRSDFKIEYVVTEDDFISFSVPSPPGPAQKASSEKWQDAEVQALLSLYATKTMHRDFEGQKQNMRIFEKISNELANIGIHHTTKQCREKVKKLKQDYKKIKEINESGAEFKKSKWFNILDSILGKHPEYSESTVPSSESSPTEPLESIFSEHNGETRESTEERVFDSENKSIQLSIDPVLSSSGLKIACVVSEAGDCSTFSSFPPHMPQIKRSTDKWFDVEVKALLSLYATKEMERDSEGQTHTRIFEQISTDLANIGIYHNAKQCREKIKKLKQDYKKIKDYNNQYSGEIKTSKWYEILDSILGHLPAYSGGAGTTTDNTMEPLESMCTENSTDSLDHLSKSSQIQPYLGGLLGSTPVAFSTGDPHRLSSPAQNRPSGHLALDSICEESGEMFKMSNDKWHDAEVQAFLSIYATKKMQQDAEGQTQTKIFPGISRELAKIGIHRTARHCREKIKKLKQDYRRIKSHNLSGAQFKKSKWYNILDSILGNDPAYSVSAANTSENSSMEMQEENNVASTVSFGRPEKLCLDETSLDGLSAAPAALTCSSITKAPSPAPYCPRGNVSLETTHTKNTEPRDSDDESASDPEVSSGQLPHQLHQTDGVLPCPPVVRSTALRFRPVKRKRKESSELVECLKRMHEQHLQHSRDMHAALLTRMDTHMAAVIGLMRRMAAAMEAQAAKQPVLQ